MAEKPKRTYSLEIWLRQKEKARRQEINQEVLMRLLNAIWKASPLSRNQKVADLGIISIRQSSPTDESPFFKEIVEACDLAIAFVRSMTEDKKRLSLQVHMVYDWIPDRAGDIHAGSGLRKLKLRISSISHLQDEKSRAIHNLYNREQRIKKKRLAKEKKSNATGPEAG